MDANPILGFWMKSLAEMI